MTSLNGSSRDADKFVVRLPDGMRDQVAKAANADDRSMNSMIVKAIREYLDLQQRQQVLLGVLMLAARPNTELRPALNAPAEFNIDEHVRMAADAKRYRHLRDRECIEDTDNDLLVLRGETYFTGDELDAEIDAAMRLEQLQQAAQEHQP